MSAPVWRTSPSSRPRRRTSSGRPAIAASRSSAPFRLIARAAADVVDAPADAGRGAGGAGRRDDVGDEREVARLPAVAEQLDRAAGDRRSAEAAERHVGPLARAVDREEPQRHRVDAVLGVVEPAQLLRRELGDAVRRQRLRRGVLARRHPRGVAVDRGRGRVDDPPPGARRPPPRAAAAWRRRCCGRSGRSACPSSTRTPGSAARWNTTSRPASSGSSAAPARSARMSRKRSCWRAPLEVRALVGGRVVVGEAVDAERRPSRPPAAPRSGASR